MTIRSTDKKNTHTGGEHDLPSKSKHTGKQTSPTHKKGGTDWTRDVLDAIIREAKGGSVKHQELFLKYRQHFNASDGDEDLTEIVYEARFVDDTTKDPEDI
ncbi:MAG: hypothetical protein JW885_09300 [Deltaproteobacteria bacterium]|nr:hypothetical protein [Candidatus Zymogenaceae bacterium]